MLKLTYLFFLLLDYFSFPCPWFRHPPLYQPLPSCQPPPFISYPSLILPPKPSKRLYITFSLPARLLGTALVFFLLRPLQPLYETARLILPCCFSLFAMREVIHYKIDHPIPPPMPMPMPAPDVRPPAGKSRRLADHVLPPRRRPVQTPPPRLLFSFARAAPVCVPPPRRACAPCVLIVL